MDNVAYREEVTRGELPHAMRGYRNLGYPPAGYVPASNGMVTIIIMAPPQTTFPDWRKGAFAHDAPPHAWHIPRFDWRAWVQIACVAAIVVGVGYLIYGMAVGDAGDSASMAALLSPLAVPGIEQLADLLPQQTPPQTAPAPWWRFWNQEPDTVPPQQAAQEGGGWTWPPQNPVGDAIDGTIQAVTWLIYAALILVVLWFVSFVIGIVRR